MGFDMGEIVDKSKYRFEDAAWTRSGRCAVSTDSTHAASACCARGCSTPPTRCRRRACSTSWARDRIQVNAVLPGWIDTALTREARKDVSGLHERVLARTPAGRWGVPEDLAGIAVFLCSRESDFVTGAAIPVDGGYSSLG